MEKYITINQNGASIRSKLYCTDMKSIRSVIVFGHGFSGHKDTRAAEKMAARIQKRRPDAALITFDWPCHGEDASNKLRLSDCDKYLGQVIAYLNARFRPEALYACATSFGGYLFLRYIAENGCPFRKVALRCPAVNMYDSMTARIMKDGDLDLIKKGKPALVGFDRKVKITRDFLSELKECDITQIDFSSFADDIAIIHGTKDEIIPYDISKAFAEKNGLHFFTVDAADHRFTDPAKMDEAIDLIRTFFSMK